MTSFKLEKANQFDHAFLKIDQEIQIEDLFDITVAFQSNMRKVSVLGDLVPILLMFTCRAQYIRDSAALQVTGHLNMHATITDEQISAIGKIWDENIKAEIKEDEFMYFKSAGSFQAEIWTTNIVELHPGIHALLAAMLAGAWTAFESLATDLWLVAVNLRPATLAENVVENRTGRPKEDRESLTEKDQEKMVPFSLLKDHNFNISRAMGDVLKERKKVSFESLVGIRRAYECAFVHDKEHPSQTLKALFTVAHTDMVVLQAMRNLLAHRGGRIDQKFKDEVKKVAPELHNLPLHAAIPLDGEIVAKYTDSASKLSVGLLRFVEKWLTQHPV